MFPSAAIPGGDFVIIGILVVKVNVLLYPVKGLSMAVLYVIFLVYLLSVLVQKLDNLVVATGMVLLWRCNTALSNLLLQGLLPSLPVNSYPLNLDCF